MMISKSLTWKVQAMLHVRPQIFTKHKAAIKAVIDLLFNIYMTVLCQSLLLTSVCGTQAQNPFFPNEEPTNSLKPLRIDLFFSVQTGAICIRFLQGKVFRSRLTYLFH